STPSVAKRSTKKKPVVASGSKRSATHSTKAHRVAHNAKRAKPLPRLHVGSASAELVGTTSDGKWILSVADSGRRIIVPPPPGYGQSAPGRRAESPRSRTNGAAPRDRRSARWR